MVWIENSCFLKMTSYRIKFVSNGKNGVNLESLNPHSPKIIIMSEETRVTTSEVEVELRRVYYVELSSTSGTHDDSR